MGTDDPFSSIATRAWVRRAHRVDQGLPWDEARWTRLAMQEKVADGLYVVTGPWRRTIANTLQQVLAANATEEGTFDPSLQSEDVLTAICADRGEKIDEITEWTNVDVPLVPVATEYAPYGTAVKPAGNVLWVDPYTETTFLDTLSEIGVVELLVNEN